MLQEKVNGLNNFNIEYYIDRIENKSELFGVDELVTVCKRINNTKRDYLFVNPLQGKYIPVVPSRCLKLLDELADEVNKNIDRSEKVLVIGFAETATAIGRHVASKLPNCYYRLQTTREIIKGVSPCIQFEEEHSHATSQLMYGTLDIIKQADRILFVEDEITTGNTILNFVRAIKELAPNLKFSIASILNWQSEENAAVFNEKHIDTIYLVKGYIKDLKHKVPLVTHQEVLEIHSEPTTNMEVKIVYTDRFNYEIERLGCKAASIELGTELEIFILNTIEDEDKVLVVGTEEYMYVGLQFANSVETLTNAKVKFHATSRSPIMASKDEGYIINSSYTLQSAYEATRKTFLYNIEPYSKVIIVTDSDYEGMFFNQISNIFKEACDECAIYCIKVKGVKV